jgi:Spy/CpxP family protein refolding chaperone
MAVDYNTVSEKLFKVLKGQGYSVQMFDDNEGMEISDPTRARFFYVKLPNIMVNVDQQNGEIKMHKGPESVDSINKSIQSIKNLAKNNLLDFDLREFGREIKPKNYTFRLNTNTMKDITTESYTTLAGTTKTSSQNLEGAKLLIKHRNPVNEEIPGSRSRNIKALYIENAEGERFKYPFIHLNGARAMTRHVQSGGNPYDEIGQSIVNISEQLSKIREVTNIVRRSPNMLEQASSIYNSLLAKQDKLRETMKRLTTSTGYDEYVENFSVNSVSEVSQDALNKIKEKFTVSNIDSRLVELLPMIHQIHEEEMENLEGLVQRIQSELGKGAPFELNPRSPSQQEYNPDNIKQFTSHSHMMAYKLNDMSVRAKNDEVAVFLDRMSDKLTGDKTFGPITKNEIDTLKNVLANIKDLDKSPKPKDKPQVITKREPSLYEVDQLTESFNRILGVFNDLPIATQSNTVAQEVSEDISASEMMQLYTPEQRQKINDKAQDMMRKDGKDTGDHKLWQAYLNSAARILGIQKVAEDDLGEDNAFNTAAAKAAVAGEKNFTFNGKSYPVKIDKDAAQKLLDEDPMSKADMDRIAKQEFDGMRMDSQQEFEEYRDAVQDDIKDPTSEYAGKSTEEIVAMLRKEADSIGYADVSDGDRHPSEPEWLRAIADEMEKPKQEDADLDRIKHLAGLTSN